jgi:hypothetical protein
MRHCRMLDLVLCAFLPTFVIIAKKIRDMLLR